MQKNLQPAIKDATNPFCKNRYATLNSVMDSCRNALLDHGILLTQYPVPVEGENLGLVTKLVHAESGQYQASLAVIPLARPDAQAMGSAFTYGRRYALSAMLGIVAEEDDDGNLASHYLNDQRQKTAKTPPPKTIPANGKNAVSIKKTLTEMIADLGLSDLLPCYREYLRDIYGNISDRIPVDQYNEQKAMLENCKKEPLAMRNFMRTLHQYK